MPLKFTEKHISTVFDDFDCKFNVVGVLDFVNLSKLDWTKIYYSLKKLHKDHYENNDRILIVMDHDWYHNDESAGMLLTALQRMINHVDISNFFIELITTNHDINNESLWIRDNIDQDLVDINITLCQGKWSRLSSLGFTKFDTSSVSNMRIGDIEGLNTDHYNLLFNNPSFCMAPWTHLSVSTDQKVHPCCKIKTFPLGDLKLNTLKEIWNNPPLKELRKYMLAGQRHPACSACYVEDDANKNSYRQYINRKLMHHVTKTDLTSADGSFENFEINYLHFHFNNLCNLACRTCGPSSSSSWHAISSSLGEISANTSALVTANHDGKLFQEFKQHLNFIDLIKFTGGEPLMIQEFYDILDLLIDQGRTDIELFYNTNLMQLNYRGRSILELWKKFPRVTIGASLDAESERGEYLRSFSNWQTILENHKQIKEQCPNVYFFVSATLSIINALHLPDFHRSWVEKGLINPQDFDINLVIDPEHLSLTNAPSQLKESIKSKYCKHLEWVRQVDKTGRSANTFESVIKLVETPEMFDKEVFWNRIKQLDQYHRTDLLTTFPELEIIPK
jgi:MoaA/NifB/PqqE/SkfB family radical SAM enzyme